MSLSLDDFIVSLELERGCSRKECSPLDARRLASTASGLFKRITENMHHFKTESDTCSGIERPSLGWVHGALRDALRIIELTVDAFCAGLGVHVPRDRSVGARKCIALFLLHSAPECPPQAPGGMRNAAGDGAETRAVRRGRHAVPGAVSPELTDDDLVWLRRRVKYPGSDIPHDELYLEMERAFRLARLVHANLSSLLK